MSDKYAYWRNALDGKFGPVHDGDPQSGYYRQTIAKYNIDRPVAIWEHEGRMVAKAGFHDKPKEVDAGEIWTSVCQNPITSGTYEKAYQSGAFEDTIATATIGHNQSADPREALAIELEGEKEIAEQFLKTPINDDDAADKAAAWSKKFQIISKKADDQRKVEKQPHIDAGAAVDAKWNPIRDDAKDLSNRLKRHIDPYLQKKQAEERERQRKAQEEADRKRREAEEAARKAQEAAVDDEAAKAEAERLLQEAEAAEKATAERNAQAGRTGAKVSLRTFTFAEITDYDALIGAIKNNPEVKELAERLANAAARAGNPLPGTEIKQEKRAA